MNHLYIIGNGFDLHHEINSSYINYRDWLAEKDPNLLWEIEEFFGFTDNEWWSNFEESLASIDAIEYGTRIASENYPDFASDDFRDSDWYDAENEVELQLEKIYNSISQSFKKWINQLNTPNPNKKIKIEDSSLFINFNYTSTLEDMYRKPSENILHIHGSIKSGTELIFGHGKTENDLRQNFRSEDFVEERAVDAAVSGIMSMRKDVETIIKSNADFFKRIREVKFVYVFGLSLSPIDIPYINEVKKHVLPSTIWEFSYHSEKDKEKANRFAKENKMNFKLVKLSDLQAIHHLF